MFNCLSIYEVKDINCFSINSFATIIYTVPL